MVEENKNQEVAAVEQPVIQQPEAEEKPKISQEERILSALAYMSIAFVMPLILKPDSKMCQFHARQGAGMFALCILVLIMLMAMPMLGTLLFLGFFGLSVLAIFRAYTGEQWKIPVIGDIAGKLDLNKLLTPVPAKKKEEPKATTPAEQPKQ